MNRYAIKGETLSGIADAVRSLRHEKGPLSPAEIEAKIREVQLGIPFKFKIENHVNPETGKWERPNEWPDLDSINIPDDFDGWYLTYDLSKTPGYGWIGIVAGNEEDDSQYYVERGHLESGGFVVEESHTIDGKDYFRQPLDELYGQYQVWRVRSDHHFTRVHFTAISTVNADNYAVSNQPCVERRGRMPYVTDLRSEAHDRSGWNNWRYGTYWLERDSVRCGGKGVCTRLDGAWSGCYSLQSLDLSGWDTTNWAVTTLYNAWSGCYSLQSLDLSGWDTTNWVVTSLGNAWQNCYSLQSLDLSGWDTTNWAVTTLGYAWSGCYSLQSLDLSGWDTTNWVVTSLGNAFCYMRSLTSLKQNFNTSNWQVTSLTSVFGQAHRLKTLDVSGWNTANWAVTTINNFCDYAYELRELNFSGWDTSKFKITASVANMLAYSQKLETIVNFPPLDVNFSLASNPMLTTASVLDVINSLPSTTSKRTLTLGQTNRLKLTEAQIAMATQKGWTIA